MISAVLHNICYNTLTKLKRYLTILLFHKYCVMIFVYILSDYIDGFIFCMSKTFYEIRILSWIFVTRIPLHWKRILIIILIRLVTSDPSRIELFSEQKTYCYIWLGTNLLFVNLNYFSTTMEAINLKRKLKYAQFSELQQLKFVKQMIEYSEYKNLSRRWKISNIFWIN